MTTAFFVDVLPHDMTTEIMQLILSASSSTLPTSPHTPYNRVPAPVNTTSSCSIQNRRIIKNLVKGDVCGTETCAICLDVIRTKYIGSGNDKHGIQLPCCGQQMHILCLFSLVPAATLGAACAVSCPFCRHRMNIETLCKIGVNTQPSALIHSTRVCNAIQCLRNKTASNVEFDGVLNRASKYTISDGFVYNCTLINLDRALYHRKQLYTEIENTLSSMENRNCTSSFNIISRLFEVHIEVLIQTRQVWQEQY